MRRRGSDAVGDAKPVFSFTGAGLDDGWGPSGDAATRRAAPVSPRRPRVRMAHRAVASDVTLAMLVSNNVYFSTCWWVATVASTFAKTNGARRDFDDIRPIMIAMFMLFEPARLYAGFAGNLQEKVPMLLGFVALSVFVAIPVLAFFWFAQEQATAFDRALNTVAVLIVLAEVVAGANATRKVLNAQSLAFFQGDET